MDIFLLKFRNWHPSLLNTTSTFLLRTMSASAWVLEALHGFNFLHHHISGTLTMMKDRVGCRQDSAEGLLLGSPLNKDSRNRRDKTHSLSVFTSACGQVSGSEQTSVSTASSVWTLTLASEILDSVPSWSPHPHHSEALYLSSFLPFHLAEVQTDDLCSESSSLFLLRT